jgi:hypothetical protein
MLSGECDVQINGEWLHLRPGQALLIPQGVKHLLKNRGWGPAVYVASFFSLFSWHGLHGGLRARAAGCALVLKGRASIRQRRRAVAQNRRVRGLADPAYAKMRVSWVPARRCCHASGCVTVVYTRHATNRTRHRPQPNAASLPCPGTHCLRFKVLVNIAEERFRAPPLERVPGVLLSPLSRANRSAQIRTAPESAGHASQTERSDCRCPLTV